MDDIKRHPEHWEQVEGYRIKDPDGWRNAGIPWNTPVTHEEFLQLSANCTIDFRPI